MESGKFWRTVGLLALGAIFQLAIGSVASRVFKAVISNRTILDVSFVVIWLAVVVVGGSIAVKILGPAAPVYPAETYEQPRSPRNLKKLLKSVTGETLVGDVLSSPREYEPTYVSTWQVGQLRLGEVALLRRLAIRPDFSLTRARCEQILSAGGMSDPSLALGSMESTGYI